MGYYEHSTLIAPQTAAAAAAAAGPRRPSLPSNLFENSIPGGSPTIQQHFSSSSSDCDNHPPSASVLAMARKLSLDESSRAAAAAVEYISTRREPYEEEESLHQQERQTMSLSPVQMPAALSAHAPYFGSSKQQQQQQPQQHFKQMAFSRRDQVDDLPTGGMDWDATNSQLSNTSIGSESMISSTSSSSSIATAASGVSSMAPPSTVNTSYSTPKVCDIPLSASSSLPSPSFAVMAEITKSEFSSASPSDSSHDDMDDDDDEEEDCAPPPLSRSCGSMGSLDLHTPARQVGHGHGHGHHSHQSSSSSSSTGQVGKWDERVPAPVYSLDGTIKSPKMTMYRSSSQGKDASIEPSSLGRPGLGQSLGLFLGDSPNQQQLPSSSSSSSDLHKASNGSPQLFRMQRPQKSSSLLAKRHSLALSPLKIGAASSAAARPNQPQTPGGNFVPYARDGAATGEIRSPFEPPTPLRALPAGVDGFPFGPLGRSPVMGNVALRNTSGNGSLSPISADFAAALTISHPKLRDDSQSRSPSPAGSRRTSMMEPATPSSNKRIKESSSMDGSRGGATTGPTRPKMVKSKSAIGKPYGSPIAYRTQQRENSPTSSSPLSKEPTNANGPPPTPSGFVKPLIIATPPQGHDELPQDELPGLPAPILQYPSGYSSGKSTAKASASSSTDARVGKPVQMQAPPMDRSMSEPVFPTVSAKHLAHRRLHPVFEAKYTLGHELGSGGFGFVVRASSNVDQRPVAVKFIWKDKVPSHGWVRDPHLGVIPMEAFALKVIDHPNVVKFIELFDDEEFFYLVMEMHGSPWKAPETEDKLSAKKDAPSTAPGTPDSLKPPARPVPMERRSSYDLFECIEQHSRLTEEQARWVFAQVVEAVWYLDTLGICHRDIKDENCVVDKDFNVKLIDFGSAVLSDPRKPPPYFNRFFGTMTFASSEILQGKQYRAPHAEVWSLGVLLSILLSGQCPFADPGAAIKGQISKPKGMWTRDSLGLMLRCLEVNPDTRATISEIRNHPWVSRAWDMNDRKRAQPL